MYIWRDTIGTISTFFKIGANGVILKTVSGALYLRNAPDTADATLNSGSFCANGTINPGTSTKANLPTTINNPTASSIQAGAYIWCSDGLKPMEITNGTGCMVVYSGSAWLRLNDYSSTF